MRKLFLLFWALLATTCLWAHDFVVDGIYYNFLDGNNVAVTYRGNYHYDSNEYFGEVSIPESVTYDGITYNVTSIGERAFRDCSSLTSIIISNGVTSIGDAAFYQCSSLTSITIGNSVTSIGNYAFQYCSSLTSITIPNSVTSIGDYAFDNCSSLTSVTIPNSVTSIGRLAFSRCRSLVSMVIPGSVMRIGYGAFSRCSSLSSITIPNSVVSIGEALFVECSSLVSIVVESGNPTYDSRENCNAIIETATNTLIAGCQSTIIPNNVTSIGYSAFDGCTSLTSITIPESVTSIGSRAFSGCTSLTSITIPNSVTSIGNGAFEGCSSLTSVTIPNSVTSIGNGAFGGCNKLTTPVYNAHCFAYMPNSYNGAYTIPDGIKQIAGYAFSGCSSLTSITIPNSVTSIGEYAFYYCTSLASVTIPNSVTSIGESAFRACSSLNSITIPNSVINIGRVAFEGTGIYNDESNWENDVLYIDNCLIRARETITGTYNIKENTRMIGGGAFWLCTSLESIIIPESVTNIGEFTFVGCESITSIALPNRITSIGLSTFNQCSSLNSVTIPNSVTSIGESAFRACSSLTSITIPNSVTSIGHTAFYNCSSLDTIYVEATTPPTIESNTFTNTPASICYIPCGTKSAYEASDWAQYMGEFVEHAVELTSGICGENLFWEYADTKLSISGTGAMYDNIVECLPWAWLLDSIRSIEMSEGITHIAAYAFDGCSALRELHLPASVLAIGEYAFGNTPRLYEITCLAPEPPVADISSFTNYDAYLHAYCDAQRYYSIDPIWKNFHNIECIVTENEVTGDVTITPSDYEATVVWLSHADAAAYALVITKNDVTFCTLKFNKYGQLTNIAFAPSRTHHNKQQAAEATSTGYSFTITGLDENTTYGYAFSVLNEESAVIEEFVGEFTTQSNVSSAVDNVDASNHSTQKLLRNGQLIIVRDGVEYTVMGQEM